MFQYFSYGFLFIFLAFLAYQDFLYRKIPNRLMLYGFIISLVLKIPVCNGILEIIAYPLIPFFLLLPVWFLHGIGAADIKLFCIISLYLNPEKLLICIFNSFILGAVFGILILICGRLGQSHHLIQKIIMKRSVPMAVCIFVATVYCMA
ncbi:MAG: prepilin peptidase [Lachnospiraceae bacterium]|nr:prepilin peptidase [Lachnospiraceae bacterium]MBR2403139.1 prepilin peptidase [Lachnospiraceae bacterium]